MADEFEILKGKRFKSVVVSDKEIQFLEDQDCKSFRLFHSQDCCEDVWIEDIDGDIINGLPGKKIEDAYASYSGKDGETPPPENSENHYIDDSYTWSFYVIRTMQDTFTIRFFGTSNGWYSETAELAEFNPHP